MKISEVFESIQGEGKYAGTPVIFVRTSGCTRKCSFCDTAYHIDGTEYIVEELAELIKQHKSKIVVWTGGEPLLQLESIIEIGELLPNHIFHLETNGDLIKPDNVDKLFILFDYISISPKDLETAKRIYELLDDNVDTLYDNDYQDFDEEISKFDIKVVTDLTVNKELIPYATILMPLTTYTDNDLEIEKNVWNYCVENNIKISLRQHVHVWGKSRGK